MVFGDGHAFAFLRDNGRPPGAASLLPGKSHIATSLPATNPGLASCVTVSYMSRARQFSARLDASVVDRLERRGARAGLNKSRLAERYIDEGTRMEDHPGVVFRDGPSGRRAGLAGGPDIWEIIATIRASGLDGEDAVRATAEWGSLTVAQVRTAVRYYAEYREEIDERIARNVEEADATEERWRREQTALA